jgi:hypothetical protein
MTADSDIVFTLGTVARALEELGVIWAVGGSVASTVYGEPRSTNDVDVVAALEESQMPALKERLGSDFYADLQTMKDAARTHDSFNLIDERTFLKVDVFVPPSGPMGAGQLDRRRARKLGDSLSIYVLGPEDTILQKLRRFRLGGETSERQWRDIVAMLRHSHDVDRDYLERTARNARLDALLAKVREDADDTDRA